MGFLMRIFGHRLFHRTLAGQTHSGGLLDIKFGFALLRDRRVPVRFKLIALALGAGLVSLLVAMELPLETILATLLPILGFVGDAMADGLEAVAGPFILGALLMPFVVPKPLVDQILAEREAIPGEFVPDPPHIITQT